MADDVDENAERHQREDGGNGGQAVEPVGQVDRVGSPDHDEHPERKGEPLHVEERVLVKGDVEPGVESGGIYEEKGPRQRGADLQQQLGPRRQSGEVLLLGDLGVVVFKPDEHEQPQHQHAAQREKVVEAYRDQ